MSDWMTCEKCKETKLSKDIQLSHDVPRYVGGIDKDGRHYLCKKCHDIYERTVFAAMVKSLSEEIKRTMCQEAKKYSKAFFREENL